MALTIERLHRTGCEQFTWTVTDAASPAPVALSTDGGTVWTDLAWTGVGTVGGFVAGPDAANPPTGAHVLAMGSVSARLKVTVGDEVVVRDAGGFTVY